MYKFRCQIWLDFPVPLHTPTGSFVAAQHTSAFPCRSTTTQLDSASFCNVTACELCSTIRKRTSNMTTQFAVFPVMGRVDKIFARIHTRVRSSALRLILGNRVTKTGFCPLDATCSSGVGALGPLIRASSCTPQPRRISGLQNRVEEYNNSDVGPHGLPTCHVIHQQVSARIIPGAAVANTS